MAKELQDMIDKGNQCLEFTKEGLSLAEKHFLELEETYQE